LSNWDFPIINLMRKRFKGLWGQEANKIPFVGMARTIRVYPNGWVVLLDNQKRIIKELQAQKIMFKISKDYIIEANIIYNAWIDYECYNIKYYMQESMKVWFAGPPFNTLIIASPDIELGQ